MTSSRILRTLLALAAVVAVALVGPGAVGARAEHHAHPQPQHHHRTGLVVDGAVAHRQRLDARDLAALPQQTVTVTYSAGGKPTTSTFSGPLLLDVLNGARPRFDPAVKNDALAFAVRATGADRYRAVLAWGEIDPGFAGTQALVATSQDGQPLAKPRLVVPGDAKGGRYVSDLVELRLVDLG